MVLDDAASVVTDLQARHGRGKNARPHLDATVYSNCEIGIADELMTPDTRAAMVRCQDGLHSRKTAHCAGHSFLHHSRDGSETLPGLSAATGGRRSLRDLGQLQRHHPPALLPDPDEGTLSLKFVRRPA